MSIPLSGLILMPLSLWVFLFRPSALAPWAIFVCSLQAAAVANLGGAFTIGISPYYFVGGLIALRLFPLWLSGRMLLFEDEPTTRYARMLVVFIAWSALSAFLLPWLFAGLPIDDPRMGVDRGYFQQTPLRFTPSNLGQAQYMVCNLIVVLYMLRMSRHRGFLDDLAKAFEWSGIFVVAVGTYQWLCHRFGLTFPTWLFNSNTSWAQSPAQFIAGVQRISATFVEPSEAGGFLAAWAIFELVLALGGEARHARAWLWAASGAVMLAATTSTTGYVALAVMWMLLGMDCVRGVLQRGRIKVRSGLSVSLGAVGVAAMLLWAPNASAVLDAVLFSKDTSASALHRTATLGRAVGVFLHSWGLGAGLGSNRAMSLLFYVPSNLGLPGLVLFFYLLFALGALVLRQLRRGNSERATTVFLAATGSAFVANLVSLSLSGAEISEPRLWILWGMLLAGVRYAWFTTSPKSPLPFPVLPDSRGI